MLSGIELNRFRREVQRHLRIESDEFGTVELIVFDLDFTLWDCGGTWCDCLSPPFRMQQGRLVDRGGRQVRFYSDVMQVLDFCDERQNVAA